MHRPALTSVCSLALLIGGCPKRQTTTRIVYFPLPTPDTAKPSGQAVGALVIEEPVPPPPRPQETAQPAPPARSPAHRPRPATKPGTDTPEETPEPPAPEPPAAVPALEPRETPQHESELRRELQEVQRRAQDRIARLSATRLSTSGRRIIEDARTFLAQSGKALEEGDLPRALTLARKASLLVSAMDQ